MDAMHIHFLNIIALLTNENDALKARVLQLEEQVRLLNKRLYGQSSESSGKRQEENKKNKNPRSEKPTEKDEKQTSDSPDTDEKHQSENECESSRQESETSEQSVVSTDEVYDTNEQEPKSQETSADKPSEETQAANDETDQKPKGTYRGGGGRNPLPEHLPRVECEHEASEHDKICPHCNREMDVVDKSIVETLAVIPLLFYVIQNVYHIYRCGNCSKERETPRPPSMLPRSQATPSLLAHIVISKLTDALPLYRQAEQALRQACDLSRSKMNRWFIKAGLSLELLVAQLETHYNSHPVGGVDETRIQVVVEPGRKASQLSCLWVRYGGKPNQRVNLVTYREGKDQKTVNKLMKSFSGSLTCDMYQCFHGLVKHRTDIDLYACHDHARRRFDQAWEVLPKDKRADSHQAKILALYDELYAIERAIKGRSKRVRKKVRWRKSRKILKKIYKYIEGLSVRPNSKFGDAISYMLKYQPELERFLSNPDVPMSNILCEHIAKRVALARKNFLFAFSAEGAHAMANLMSLVYTAQLYKRHNLHHYLTVVFTKLPYAKTASDLEALLPFNLTPEQVAKEMKKMPMPSELSEWLPNVA